jgi:hypothetical protein
VSNSNPALTSCARLRLARLIVEDGWSVSMGARCSKVFWRSAKRPASRYAELGPTAMGSQVGPWLR